jgi:hypothetical protein
MDEVVVESNIEFANSYFCYFIDLLVAFNSYVISIFLCGLGEGV